MIAVEPKAELGEMFDAAGGTGKPRVGQLALCYDADREAAPWTETEQLAFEKETPGLYWSGHPVDRYAGARKLFGAKTVADPAGASAAPASDEGWGPGGEVIGGALNLARHHGLAHGDKFRTWFDGAING